MLVDQRYQRKKIVNLITVFYGDILLNILVFSWGSFIVTIIVS